jgi:hypothetical protein
MFPGIILGVLASSSTANSSLLDRLLAAIPCLNKSALVADRWLIFEDVLALEETRGDGGGIDILAC